MKLALLALDEHMPGWRPKTSKLGGLFNHAHVSRKPAPLGSMLKNAVECKSSEIEDDDVVKSIEKQPRKKNSKEKASLSDGSNPYVRVTEVLR